MGLLSEGEPLSWEDTHKYADHVRQHGVEQFVHLYNRLNARRGDVLKWGDEIEYFVIRIDDATKTAKVSMRAEELLHRLQEPEREAAASGEALKSLWRPEYSSYCIEGTPGAPYSGQISCFNEVELNMKFRRDEVERMLKDDEILVSMSIFPRLGVDPFTHPPSKPGICTLIKSLFRIYWCEFKRAFAIKRGCTLHPLLFRCGPQLHEVTLLAQRGHVPGAPQVPHSHS